MGQASDVTALATRQIAVAEALAAEGIDVVAADPEVPAAEPAFRAGITAAGFRPIEEIQPSRHRISLPLDGDADEEAVFDGDRQVDAPADPGRRARWGDRSSATTSA